MIKFCKVAVQACSLILSVFLPARLASASASVTPGAQDPHAAPSFYVVDAAGLEDESDIFTLTALQGIVNRDAPRLFVRAYFHKFGPEKQVFMDYLSREKGYHPNWVSLGEAVQTFTAQGLLKGIVRYDASRYEQACIAATLAGLDDLLPVSESAASRRTTLLSNKDRRVEERFDLRNPNWTAYYATLTTGSNGTSIRRNHGITGHTLAIKAPFAGLETWLSIDINKTHFLEVRAKNLGDVWSLIFDQGAVHTGQSSWVWIEKNTKKDGILSYDLTKIPHLVGGRRRTLVRFIVPTESSQLQIESFRLLNANHALVKEEPVQRDWFSGLKTKVDLTKRFSDSDAAWQWATSELLPKTSTHYAFAAQPGWFNTRGIDFAVSNKAFVFQKMNGKGKAEQNPYAMGSLLDGVLQHLERPGAMLGWLGDEWKSVTILTAHGHGVFHSGAANLSFWAKVPTSGPVKLPRNETPGKQLENKYYVCFGINPGDTPNGFLSLWWNDGNWLDPARGKVPMTWLISPTAQKAIPAVVEFFAKTSTPKDTFMIAPTGALYTYPSAVLGKNENLLFPLIDETRRLAAQMGLEGMMMWDTSMQYPYDRWFEPGLYPPVRFFQKSSSGSPQSRYQNLYLNDGTPLVLAGNSRIYQPSVPFPEFNYDNLDRIQGAVPYTIELLKNIAAHHPPPFFISMEMRLPPSIHKQIFEAMPSDRFEFVGAPDMVSLARQSSQFVVTSRDDAITPGSSVAVDVDLYNPDGIMGEEGVVTWKLPSGFTTDQRQWMHPRVAAGQKVSRTITLTAPRQLNPKQVEIRFYDSRQRRWDRTVALSCFQGNTVVVDDFKDTSKWNVRGEGEIVIGNGMAEFRPAQRNLHEYCLARAEGAPTNDPCMSTGVEIDFDRDPHLELNVHEVRGKFSLQIRDEAQKQTCKLFDYSTAIGKTITDLRTATHWSGKKRVTLLLYPRINSGGSLYVNSIKIHYDR